uniref:Retrovirus-related Pol polyprotein LINE-1 n=1 Tax=Tanacetum cinerariifolium TaxID=118510 RepID=A0A6L2LXZ2_TANCI|nr:retrovirus-related Pol polyprotein LINE-1 [Tanacetum cinerariifolium]
MEVVGMERGYYLGDFDGCCKGKGEENVYDWFWQEMMYKVYSVLKLQGDRNGVDERKNKVLQDMINAMLVSANLPKNLWGEALLTACRVNLDSNVIAESRDVDFFENKFCHDSTSTNEIMTQIPQDISSPDLNSFSDNENNVFNKIPVLLNVEDAPKTYKEAITSRNSAFWKEALDDEMDSLVSNNTWKLSDSSDRIISLMLVIDGATVNVINTYAPQVGLSEVKKTTFWDYLDKVMRECLTSQRLILGGDLNGHIGATTEGYAGVHGGFGYEARNEEGRAILDFATAYDLEEFRYRVAEGVSTRVEDLAACDVDSMWNNLASIIKDVVKDTLRVAIETSKTHMARRESWWRCEEVQSSVTVKQARFRELLLCREGNEKEWLGALERITKAQERIRRDLEDICFIKDEEEGHKEGVGPNREPHTECYYSRISQAEVRTALQKMGKNKAVGPDQIPIEAWKSLGDEGTFWLTSLFNKIFTSAKMPEEWRLSEFILIFKNKVEAIHIIKSLMEKYMERQRDLHMAFLDLEKAYDSILRELIWKTLVDKGTSKRYIRVIRDMYDGAKTRVRTLIGSTEFFLVDEDILWYLIFADDIVLVLESAKDLNTRLENWRKVLEDNGLRVSQEKTEYLICDFSIREISHNKEVDILFASFPHCSPCHACSRWVRGLVPSCFAIFDLEHLSLSFDFVNSSEIFKSLSFNLDRLFHLAILCLDQHAHALHHLESLLTISLDRLDILKEDLCILEFAKVLVFDS